MSRLSQKEKLYGIIVGIYGIVALSALWVPHFSGTLPKGAQSPFIPWLIGTLAILLGMGIILIGLRMPAGLVMAAVGVLGPWSTYLLLAFPLVVWAGFVSFKRTPRVSPTPGSSPFFRSRPRKGAIDVNSAVKRSPTASRRYTPPKPQKKK